MSPAYPKAAPRLVLEGAALRRRNKAIDKRDRQRCAKCGVIIWSGGSRHHRKFKSRGGGDEVSNGILLCGSGASGCHGWVHFNPVSAAMLGLAVGSEQDPRMIPVQHAIYGVVWLDDEGGVSSEPPRPPAPEEDIAA